jgi:hypothetical protein
MPAARDDDMVMDGDVEQCRRLDDLPRHLEVADDLGRNVIMASRAARANPCGSV